MTTAPVLTDPAAAMRAASRAVDTNGGAAAAAAPDVLHVTGARPNFPKAAPVLAALTRRGVRQQLVHTGQHYDDRLSDIFFRELELPRPDVELGVGSGSQAEQTAAVLVAMERLLRARRPRLLVVYGDVNSALAAALAAAKLQVPVAHVEAGLRSFDASMPEEVNRRLTDVLADLLFVTSPEALAHLGAEGVPASRMHLVGNPMIDTLLRHLGRLDPAAARRERGLPRRYAVATLHRPANVDAPGDVAELVAVLHRAADLVDLVLPLHPRGRGALLAAGLADHPRVHVCEPLGYTGFLSLVQGAAVVLTDSGGVQEEATVLRVPCLTLRSSTERPVTVTSGSNRLVRRDQLDSALRSVLSGCGVSDRPDAVPPLWDGRAGERIASVIDHWLRERAVPAPARQLQAAAR